MQRARSTSGRSVFDEHVRSLLTRREAEGGPLVDVMWLSGQLSHLTGDGPAAKRLGSL